MGEEKEKIERPDNDETCDSRLAYNEEGVDLTVIRQFLALTPAERLRDAQSMANFVLSVRALNRNA
jgi:hypothetical protein